MSTVDVNCKSVSAKIDRVEVTTDNLTGRGGILLFSRYLSGVDLYARLEELFGSIRKSSKGLPVSVLFKQVFCYFVEGTSRHLVHFDALRAEAGYAGAIETKAEKMASSHMVKRFFKSFSLPLIWRFRRLLQELFTWRLNMIKPEVVVLGIDTMVMDNDAAALRHGSQPTYKKVKGFQPLQVTWGRFIVDAVFRGGSKHSNYGDTVPKTLTHLARRIRRDYREDVPIILRMDNGFFDQKIFALCDELGIGFICPGKMYYNMRRFVGALPRSQWKRHEGRGVSPRGKQVWEYAEFGDCRGRWRRFRRAFYTRPLNEDGQVLLAFARPDTILYTNLGLGGRVDDLLDAAGAAHWKDPAHIIESYHQRGADELVHRAVKEFYSEQLPFKRFTPNAAFYYSMLVAFFLYETFKEDVTASVVGAASYPTRLRRTLIDIAAKIVRTGGRTILKVTEATWKRTKLGGLWDRTADPPRFCAA